MDPEIFTLPADKISLCLKNIESYKTTRVFGPIVFLVLNYLFAFSIIGLGNVTVFIIFYIILNIATTLFSYFITSRVINKNNNIIVTLHIVNIEIVELITLSQESFQLKTGNYSIEKDIFTEGDGKNFSRVRKQFNSINIIVDDKVFILVPDWFSSAETIRTYFKY